MQPKGYLKHFQVASSGLLTRRSDQYQARRQHDTAVSGSLSGHQVTVQSNQDLLVRGNSIVSDEGTTLAAGGKIELNAAENHYRNEDTHRSRRSGFTFGMRNGVANIGYSQSRKQTLQLMKSTFRSSHRKSAITEVRTNLLRMRRYKDPAVIYRIIRAPSGRNWKRNMAGET